ncbi:MAG: hypothetical protein GOMPHAMPRED_007654 [Gomphillus americanus]|uniref:Uncharacterized protein n=1 Tax=Gomphillus americanus TaxID=1940652 RepID=A0A8H3I9G8_9LECA|nr:MAG: hypothetical protein GOMPHAMPRED_007654 [Gomphillus americanus]
MTLASSESATSMWINQNGWSIKTMRFAVSKIRQRDWRSIRKNWPSYRTSTHEAFQWDIQSLDNLDAFRIATECSVLEGEVEMLRQAKELAWKLAEQRKGVADSFRKGAMISHAAWTLLFQERLHHAQTARKGAPPYPSPNTVTNASEKLDVAQIFSCRAETKRAFNLAQAAKNIADKERWDGAITPRALLEKIDKEVASASAELLAAKMTMKQTEVKSQAAGLLWHIQGLNRKQKFHNGYLEWVEQMLQLLVKNANPNSIQPS